MDLFLLCMLAVAAGFIDAIAGGGGLIQLPAYFVFMPQLSTASLFGSNKFAGFSGTFVSTVQYLRRVKASWRLIAIPLMLAAASSLTGAHYVRLFDKEKIAPVVIVLLIIMLVHTLMRQEQGSEKKKSISPWLKHVTLSIAAIIIGFYDGFWSGRRQPADVCFHCPSRF
jgi:uncharacterized protein